MNEENATISRAGPGDAGAIAALVEQYWAFEDIAGFDAQVVAAQVARLASDPALGAAFVARREGEAVGYLLLVFVFSLENLGLTAEIDEFFVSRRHRSAGLGTALLRAAEDAARAAGCTNISLQIGKNNHAGRRKYVRHGYRQRMGYDLLEKDL